MTDFFSTLADLFRLSFFLLGACGILFLLTNLP